MGGGGREGGDGVGRGGENARKSSQSIYVCALRGRGRIAER